MCEFLSMVLIHIIQRTHLGKLFSEQISCFLFLLKSLLTRCDQLVHPGHLETQLRLALFQTFNLLRRQEKITVFSVKKQE